MSAVNPRFTAGPITMAVFAAVAGGQLVVPGTSGNVGLVGPAGAGAVNCLGVAGLDALPAGTANTSTDAAGFPVISAAIVDQYTPVHQHGTFKLTAAGTLVFGDPLKCAAAGQVAKFVDGTDNPGLKIGRCMEPLGIASGAVGQCYINIA